MQRLLFFAKHVIIAAIVFLALVSSPVYAQTATLPIEQNFTTNSAGTDWTFLGTASLTGNGTIDASGNGWLRLTGNGTNQVGSAFFERSFSSTSGVYVCFDFTIWGGNGADGISFALFDGSTNNSQVRYGASGGSLGYAQKKNPDTDGMNNGWVGIGLDEYGNYSNPTEGRNGGIGATPDAVAIRGSGSTASGNDTIGYWYLAGSNTLSEGIDIPGQSSRPNQTGNNYRNVILCILPTGETTVMLKFNPTAAYTTVINQFNLHTAPHQRARPSTFKFGVSASTGGSTNYHELRNLAIRKPSDLESTIDNYPALVSANSTYDYSVTFTNNGPNDADSSAFIHRFSSAYSVTGWSYSVNGGANGVVANIAGSFLTASATQFPVGSSVTFSFTVATGSSLPGIIQDSAFVTGPKVIGDFSPANNIYSVEATGSLPVELVAFSAMRRENGVDLEWRTETEINNYGFKIERMEASGTWREIGFIAGNGTSNTPNEYSFADQNAPNTETLYRLRQMDRDGAYKVYGPIKASADKAVARLPILSEQFPNPTKGQINMTMRLPEASHAVVTLTGADGRSHRVLAEGDYQAGEHLIASQQSDLTPGLYFVRLHAQGQNVTRKVIIIH